MINEVAANGEADSVGVLFLGSVADYNLAVCDILPSCCWDVLFMDAEKCVGAGDSPFHALR